jgi:hypothetical protein
MMGEVTFLSWGFSMFTILLTQDDGTYIVVGKEFAIRRKAQAIADRYEDATVVEGGIAEWETKVAGLNQQLLKGTAAA